MVRILKPDEPMVYKPTPKEAKEIARVPEDEALCAWIEAVIHFHTWQQERERARILGDRIANGYRWFASHGPDDDDHPRAVTLLDDIHREQRGVYQNMRSLMGVGWYWCCLTYEANKRAKAGWDRELVDRYPRSAGDYAAVWHALWGEIDPPGTPVEERAGWPERQIGTVEVWNLPEMKKQLWRRAS